MKRINCDGMAKERKSYKGDNYLTCYKTTEHSTRVFMLELEKGNLPEHL